MKGSIVVCAKNSSQAREVKATLEKWAKSQKIEIVDVTGSTEEIPKETVKNAKLGVVIGGDGTFLSLVRRLPDKAAFPVMGVNLGSLGFITEVSREEMLGVVKEALSGKFPEEKRPLLSVELQRKKGKSETILVFNDAVLAKGATSSILKFDIYLGEEHLSAVRADGYIVSTATGSTAYCLSAGGPLVHPKVKALVLIPICAHSLSARPVLVPENEEIFLRTKDLRGGAHLVCDGQVHFEIKAGDTIRFSQSGQTLRLVRLPKQKWSEALRSKLKMA